jgi:hypothetical protein
VEFAIQVVEVDDTARVDHELVPVRTLVNQRQFFSLLEHVVEVPWELKNVCMLVLIERLVGTDSLIEGFDAGLLVL